MTVKNKEPEVETQPVSAYLVERLVAGDLPADQAAQLQARLAAEPDGHQRLEDLQASNDEILRLHPPADVAEEIRRRAARQTESSRARAGESRRWLSLGVPVSLAAAFALVLVVRGATGPNGDFVEHGADENGERGKGLNPSLRVYRKAAAGRIERLKEGAPTRAGDELQLAYVAAGHRFGAVLSVDGGGQVTFHLPAVAGPAVWLRTDGETELPSSYELDAAPGFERFLFVASDEAFDASALADVARGRTPPPAGKFAVFFTVRKP